MLQELIAQGLVLAAAIYLAFSVLGVGRRKKVSACGKSGCACPTASATPKLEDQPVVLSVGGRATS